MHARKSENIMCKKTDFGDLKLGDSLTGGDLEELFNILDAIFGRAASFFQGFLDELSVFDILFVHKLLMPFDHFVSLGGFDLDHLSNILQDAKAIRNIFPEESGLRVKNDSSFNWDHWESDLSVSLVGSKDSLEVSFVLDLITILLNNSVLHGSDGTQINMRESFDNFSLDSLDFIIKFLHLISGEVIHTFIQEWDIAFSKRGFAIPIFQESVDTARMNDLVGGSKGHAQ